MSAVATTFSAAIPGLPPELGRTVDLAVSAAVDRIARMATGELASVSIALPFVVDAELVLRGGDSGWLGNHRELSLHGRGVAIRYDVNAPDRFHAACTRWQRLGAQDIAPVALFSVSSATSLPSTSIWVPRVLVRTDRDRTIVTFSAQTDATTAAEIGRVWLHELRQLLDPPPKSRHTANAFVSTTSEPDADAWRARVRAATTAIAEGRIEKVVLARRLFIQLANRVAPAELAARLARNHPGCYVLSFPLGPGFVVAATPELLASKRDRCLVSHALAGTARRYAEDPDNALAVSALLSSPKERHEHAVVVDAITARMADVCEQVAHPPAPTVLPLRFLQHLWTPVNGRLRAGASLFDAVAHLHPTPAVLGFPPRAARDWLAKIGERRDGLYSGVAGWINADGDGDAVVVLRSAYIEDRTAVLWAGAGIVAESEPDAELAETELKFATMLDVLQTA